MNTFSIIIPVYHLLEEKNRIYFTTLAETIAGNLKLPYVVSKFRELVIVNDCPEEEINDFVLSTFNKYAIRQVIIHTNQTNRGQGSSRNIGAQLASGSYLHFIDQDDSISPDFYFILLKAIEKRKAQIAFSGLNLYNTQMDENFNPLRYKTKQIFAQSIHLSDLSRLLLSNIAVSPGQYLISKSLFNKVGGYPDLLNKGTDDWGIFYLLCTQYPRTIITFRDNAVFTYRIHNRQNRKSLDMKASLSEMFNKINHKKSFWYYLLYFFKINPVGRLINKIIYRFYWRVPSF